MTALELSLNKIQETHHQKSQSRIIIDSQNEWLKQHNEKGDKYFLNPRTGNVTHYNNSWCTQTFMKKQVW